MPMQFADAPRRQSHIYGSNVFGNRKVFNRDLSRPATLLDAPVCRRE
jgi:hypothetical protein